MYDISGRNNGESVLVEVDTNGHLLLGNGVNDIGQVLNGSQDITILSNASRTTGGSTNTLSTGKYKEAIAFLDVTASSGTTPTLDVKFQTQDPTSLKWFDIAELTFTQASGVTSEMKTKVNTLGSNIRCVYTIGGTNPSFDFSVGLTMKS